MRTVRRLLYRDIVWSVAFVAIAFLSLFFFIDVVDELDNVGRDGYTLGHAMLRSLFELPGHFYELFPIAVLIGTIYAMARLAQSSEFTILRTGGLGPGRALALLAVPGIVFAALTFLIGDYAAPYTEREAVLLKHRGGVAPGRGGAWLKERRTDAQGQRNVSVNVASIDAAGELHGIRIFEFDPEGRLRTQIGARVGSVAKDGTWRLREVQRTDWPVPDEAGDNARMAMQSLAELAWRSTLDANVVAAALLPVQTMSTVELWRYSAHLTDQDQATQRHEIQFWKKAFYPLACIVMVALALPFAYLHARSGAVSYKVFGGIMLGIAFVLLNNVSGHLGVLKGWTPWLVAATPSLLFLLMSMAAFAWLVRYR
ncbi:LPS export ABC transporter permease LptG [Aquabacterium humicola]|uniref:LPS export ABC transporter permease LptG n=1 Tax=Aquabacterium humicola TaxID=3237377 RepID=UPI002543AE14|nr:LPS export ABC transporter permease LptG [Rubrivivax pictus]